MTTRREVAEHLDLETTAAGNLFRSRVLSAGMTLDTARVSYIRHLREQAAGRRAQIEDAEVYDLVAERARLAKMQADAQELRNGELRGELMQRADVKQRWASMALSWRERIRSVPVIALSRIPGISKSMARELAELIDATLVELADGTPARRVVRKHRARNASAS